MASVQGRRGLMEPELIADTGAMDENLVERVIDLLWEEFDRYVPDGEIHPHQMRAIAARIVALLNDGGDGA